MIGCIHIFLNISKVLGHSTKNMISQINIGWPLAHGAQGECPLPRLWPYVYNIGKKTLSSWLLMAWSWISSPHPYLSLPSLRVSKAPLAPLPPLFGGLASWTLVQCSLGFLFAVDVAGLGNATRVKEDTTLCTLWTKSMINAAWPQRRGLWSVNCPGRSLSYPFRPRQGKRGALASIDNHNGGC
jgi:hypothetical protein